jgi:hypothetical protein
MEINDPNQGFMTKNIIILLSGVRKIRPILQQNPHLSDDVIDERFENFKKVILQNLSPNVL